jgi:hypothetical protein
LGFFFTGTDSRQIERVLSRGVAKLNVVFVNRMMLVMVLGRDLVEPEAGEA